MAEFSLDDVNASRNYRWWTWVGFTVVFLGNGLVAALWIWALFSTPPGDHARYIIEAGLSFMIALGTILLAVPFFVTGFIKQGARPHVIVTLVFALTPVPLGIVLMHLLASWRNITLSP